MQSTLNQRNLGPFTVSSIGLGCMNLSHAYGVPPSQEVAADILLRALDLGVTHFDTAALKAHLEENLGAATVELQPDLIARLGALISQRTVAGERYNPATQAEV